MCMRSIIAVDPDLEIRDGECRSWQAGVGRAPVVTPTHHDSAVLVDVFSVIHSQEEYLDALNRLGAVYSNPAMDGTHIVFSSTEGIVYCLKKA